MYVRHGVQLLLPWKSSLANQRKHVLPPLSYTQRKWPWPQNVFTFPVSLLYFHHSSRVAKLYSHLGPTFITFLPNLGFGTNSSILALVGDFLLWNLKSFLPQGTQIYRYILENSIVVPEPVFYFFWSNEVSVLYFNCNNSKMYSVIFLAIVQIINIISCLRFINLASCKRKN